MPNNSQSDNRPQTKSLDELRAHPAGYLWQAIRPASFVGQNHSEVERRILGPVSCNAETDPAHIWAKFARDFVDALLTGASRDHLTLHFQNTVDRHPSFPAQRASAPTRLAE